MPQSLSLSANFRRLSLPRSLPAVLGVGAYLKNALCLIQGDEAWLGPDNGSLDNRAALEAFQTSAQALLGAAQTAPVAFAHDWHPDFYPTRWAQERAPRAIGIQHHHAHSAAVMAEHGRSGPVLSLALDGFGLGSEGQSWGGELLRVDASGFSRLGFLRPLPQPGGDVAAREPWRMGAACLWALGRGEEIAVRYADYAGAAHLGQMMQRGVNAPLTSSAGRLFDAACGLLGVKPVAAFEGEAPMALEALAAEAWAADDTPLAQDRWRLSESGGALVLDFLPLLDELSGLPAQKGAVLFHKTLAAALAAWAGKAAQQTDIKDIVLCGGCFFNKVLSRRLTALLAAQGLTVLAPVLMMPGDGAIALGQAYAAAFLIEQEGK